jgi:hypothetical protein
MPPKIPSTDETFGKTIDKTHVLAVKAPHIIVFALSDISVFPVNN